MKVRKRTQVEAMVDEFVAGNPKRKALLDEDYVNIQVAQIIYDLRTAAGLSQRELAKLAGTTASVICRLEKADSGHSLSMLTRIASSLGRRIELRTIPKEAA
jgi:ribosome-binding protein aMBF1 (putative translation factor)